MKKCIGMFCLALLVVTAGAEARPYYWQQPIQRTAPAKEVGPSAVLRRGLEKLIDFAAQGKSTSSADKIIFLEKEISPYFDFDYMAQWVGGARWQYLPQKERDALSGRLQKMFLTALSQKLTQYGGQRFRVLRERRVKAGEVVVPVAIQNPRGYPARLKFRFYHSRNGGWKVFDVTANSASALVYYRKEFNRTNRQQRQGYHPRYR